MDAADLARDLVAVPSHGDPDAAGDHIEAWLRDHTDAAVTRDDHGNVIARKRPAGEGAGGNGSADGGPSLALVGHHDVVPPAASQVDDDGGYVVEERDGRLYGRGAADMKGSLAAAMVAFRDSEPPSAGELVFASFVGEETGGEGCRAAIDDGFAPDYAVVGEGSTGYSAPGVTDVAVAHRGRRAVTLRAEGEAAHASMPEEGENAIYRAADAVDVVRGLDDPETETYDETMRGSVAVTEIDGGSSWNTIPDECTVTVDERTVPGDRAALERAEAIEGVSLSVEQDLPPMECRDEAFASAVRDAAAAVQDGTPQLVTKPHATDAGWLADRAGTECVVVGASERGEAHTADESVSVAVLERCERIYRLAVESFLGISG